MINLKGMWEETDERKSEINTISTLHDQKSRANAERMSKKKLLIINDVFMCFSESF